MFLPTGNSPLACRGLAEIGLLGQLGLGSVHLAKDFSPEPGTSFASTVFVLGHSQAKRKSRHAYLQYGDLR